MFHLWRKEKLVKYQIVSKYLDHDSVLQEKKSKVKLYKKKLLATTFS